MYAFLWGDVLMGRARRVGRRRYVRRSRGRVVRVKRRLYGRSRSRKRDRMWKALPPGKRISRNGVRYYEYRRNHAD